MVGTRVELALRVLIPSVTGLCGAVVGITVVRRRGPASDAYTDLATPFGAMALVYGGWSLLYAGVGLLETLGGNPSVPAPGAAAGPLIFLVMLPWAVFGLHYGGRSQVVTRERVVGTALIVLVYLSLTLTVAFEPFGLGEQQRQTLQVTASVVALGLLAVVFAISWLVLSATTRHDRFTPVAGGLALVPIIVPILVFQITRASTPVLNQLLTAGAFGTAVVAMWLGAARYDLLSDRPGTGTLGERAAVSEMDEAVFVVDREGRIVRANPAATAVFGTPDGAARLRDVVGVDVAALGERDTVECQTIRGRRQFDPRITELLNGHDEVLGHTLALFDVTDREIRRQRLQVLNRILRHNLRNRLDVIRAHAEKASNSDIVENADQLDRLSTEARRIETLMERASTTEASTHLPTVAEEVVAAITENHPAVETRLDVPDVTLEVDRGLCRYALEQLVENAVEHNDGPNPRVEVSGSGPPTGPRLVVADNGPGIPETEREVITTGTEHDLAHGSSLGLWGANWAVQTLGGRLTFGSSDHGGAAVVIELPGGG